MQSLKTSAGIENLNVPEKSKALGGIWSQVEKKYKLVHKLG